MKKCILIIVSVILPLILCFSIVKGTFGTDAFVSSSSFYEYFLTYPKEDIQEITYEFSTLDDIGFSKENIFSPDWSGNAFEDIAEIGKMIADFFVAIWDYMYFMIKVSFLLIQTIIHSVVWIFGFPSYIGIQFTN